MKKVVSLMVAVLMVVLLLPVTAMAETPKVAKIGTTEYGTLAAAIAEAISGDTITLLDNAEGGIVIDKSLTINLNGKQIDVKETVGSEGTKTSGIQLTKGNTVTIKNGTLVASTAVKFFLKNYADLTIENLTIKRDNLVSGYAAVNNCGKLTVTDCVIESANASSWAITTGNYGHDDVIVTTINSGTIDSVALETPLWETGEATVDESVTINILGGKIGKVGEYDWRPFYGGSYLDAPVLTKAVFEISGGTFGTDPAAYLAAGKTATYSSATGLYLVGDKIIGPEVAQITGGNKYATLEAAFEAAVSGDKIILLENAAVGYTISTGKRTITLDLAGKTITAKGSGLNADGNLYGTVDAIFAVNYGGKLIINDSSSAKTGKVESGNIRCAIKMTELGETRNGTEVASLEVNGGYIEGNEYGVSGNGNRHGTAIKVTGGTLTGTLAGKYLGIYNPQNGTVEISGGTIIGQVGLAMKSGSLIISGGTIEGVGEDAEYVHSANGFNNTGDALAVEACDYPGGLPVVVNISGGTFLSTEGKAVAYYQQSSDYKLANEHFITGGTFSKDPTALVASGYKAFQEGTSYRVAKLPANAIKSASAAVKTAENAATTEDAAVAISTGKLTVSGQISVANKVLVTYVCTDGKTGEIGVTYNATSELFVASPASVTVGETVYTVDVSGLGALPAEVKIAPPAVEPLKEPKDASAKEKEAVDAIKNNSDKVSASGLGAAVASETLTTTGGETKVVVGENEEKPAATIITEGKADESAPYTIKNANNEDLVVVVQPVLKIEVKDFVDDGDTQVLKFDVSAASQAFVTIKEIANGTNPNFTIANSVKVGNPVPVEINTPVTLTIPVPENFVSFDNEDNEDNVFIDHTMHNDEVETVKATYNSTTKTITFTINGMSPIAARVDARTVTVDYPDNVSKTYRADSVGEVLPTAAKAGYRFIGWKFIIADEGAIDGTYLKMTNELLNTLNGQTVTAEPQFQYVGGNNNGVVHQIGAPAAAANEENPNTGAESAIGAVAAISLVSLAAMAISKKK